MPRDTQAPLSQPVFSEPNFNETGAPTSDPTTFRSAHDPKADTVLYTQIQNLLKKDTVTFPSSRVNPEDLFTLSGALGSQGQADVQAIQKSGQIVFHSIGDSGASIVAKLPNEVSVADHLTNDFRASASADRPAFLFHLGDVVYNFGESQYYYDQFYEPFRNYPAPIFAVPGNHDSFVVPNTAPTDAPLNTFMRNFCASSFLITPEAGSLHRTAMTQPGVYFALDAPFVRIIGLFSNALEDPGLISSQSTQTTQWPGIPSYQLDFLTAQLQRIRQEKYSGAVIVALHHPPFTYAPAAGASGGHHFGNSLMLREIDAICKAQGVYPHAFVAGHAHNYQRYTRSLTFGGRNYTVPFVVSGHGGHNVNPLTMNPPGPAAGAQVNYLDPNPLLTTSGLTLVQYDEKHYGYLRITVDSKNMKLESHFVSPATPPTPVDTVTVDIASHNIV